VVRSSSPPRLLSGSPLEGAALSSVSRRPQSCLFFFFPSDFFRPFSLSGTLVSQITYRGLNVSPTLPGEPDVFGSMNSHSVAPSLRLSLYLIFSRPQAFFYTLSILGRRRVFAPFGKCRPLSLATRQHPSLSSKLYR